MSQNAGPLTFTVGATAVEAARLVTFSAARTVIHNDGTATNMIAGVTLYGAEIGEDVAIQPLNSSGTMEITAAGAIPANDKVFAAADGKVQALPVAAGDYREIGVDIEAATADGDIVEVLHNDNPTVVTVT